MVEITQAQLSGKPKHGKTCFAATPIGGDGSEIRNRSDKILNHVITPVLEPMGYTITRADKIAQAGSITSQVIGHLVTSDIVIFDLAGHNPNVFYELGVRHAANRPYIQLDDGALPIPFDITVFRTIIFDYQDLDSVEQAKKVLREMVLAYEQGSVVESPLTNVPDVHLAAGNPVLDQLASIMNLVMEIYGDTHGVRYNHTTNIMDVGVLQRFIQIYADAGEVPIGHRTALENTLRSSHLKEWARGLPTEAAPKEN